MSFHGYECYDRSDEEELDECSICGCNGSACSGCPACDPREEPAYTDAEIDQIEIAHRLMRR